MDRSFAQRKLPLARSIARRRTEARSRKMSPGLQRHRFEVSEESARIARDGRSSRRVSRPTSLSHRIHQKKGPSSVSRPAKTASISDAQCEMVTVSAPDDFQKESNSVYIRDEVDVDIGDECDDECDDDGDDECDGNGDECDGHGLECDGNGNECDVNGDGNGCDVDERDGVECDDDECDADGDDGECDDDGNGDECDGHGDGDECDGDVSVDGNLFGDGSGNGHRNSGIDVIGNSGSDDDDNGDGIRNHVLNGKGYGSGYSDGNCSEVRDNVDDDDNVDCNVDNVAADDDDSGDEDVDYNVVDDGDAENYADADDGGIERNERASDARVEDEYINCDGQPHVPTQMCATGRSSRGVEVIESPIIGLFDIQCLLAENRRALIARGLHRRGRCSKVPFKGPGAGNTGQRGAGGRAGRKALKMRTGRGYPLPSSSCLNGDVESSTGDDEEEYEEEGGKTIPERWFEYLRFVPLNFCDSQNAEAGLRGSRERLAPGEISYRGLVVNHDNNEDVLFIYRHKYEAKAVRGQSLSSYEQLRACVGQFARFAVVCGLVPLTRVCDAGRLFRTVLSMDAVQTFLSYFQLRCSASTVLAKAFHLRTVSKYAERFYCSVMIDEASRTKAALMTDYLTGACSAEKYESRRGTARMRSEDLRIASGRLLVGEDFRRFGEAAEKCLMGIMQSGERHVNRNPGLRARWCIAFVGLLVFYGGGQRPQVYAQLQEPEDLDVSLRRWTTDKRVTLAALLEKRPRQTGYSKVSFPARTRKLFEFHMRVIKPAIRAALAIGQTETERRAAWQRERGEDVDNPILLDTRTGEGYMTAQIRSTLHRFVQEIDSELTAITPSVVRSSYATWKFQAYKKGLIFKQLSEDDFLDTLAKIMNTSSEQLKATYIACREMDSNYDRVMAEVHRMFEVEEDD